MITAGSTLSTTSTSTLTFGSNATVSGGASTDSLYETGSDSTTGPTTGINDYQFADGGVISQSSTYSTNFSATDSESETFTQSQSDAAVLGGGGLVNSGTDLSTSFSTLSEAGGAPVSFGADYVGGFYTNSESSTFSDSEFDSTSLSLGTSATIAGGTDSHTHSGLDSYSQSYNQSGAEIVADPGGGPAYSAAFGQVSLVTTSLYGHDQGTLTLGALGATSGGNDSYTFIQANWNSQSLAATTATDNVTDTGSDSYSLAMTGTETLGSGGGVTGGSDSFTWWQNASDVLTMVEDGGGTSGVYTQYQLTLYDQISQDFADNGTDILGASDSIVAGSDTYTMDTDRNLATTIIDNGTSSSPYYINAYGWDDLGQHDQGASTLTTNGHVYATDTLTYGEGTTEFSRIPLLFPHRE